MGGAVFCALHSLNQRLAGSTRAWATAPPHVHCCAELCAVGECVRVRRVLWCCVNGCQRGSCLLLVPPFCCRSLVVVDVSDAVLLLQFVLGSSEFEVDVRYMNLKPVGRGAYGLVAAADDLVRRLRFFSLLLFHVFTLLSPAFFWFFFGGQITGRKVAIKRISKVFLDLIDAKRILREIKLLRHLGKHENIIEILDIMTAPPEAEDFHSLYIVTQLCECDLERIISSSQRLTDQHLQYFVYQLLRGTKYIHSANVLHRDLKPSNLLVNSNCDLAICDFGLARGVSDEVAGKLTEYVVTRWYRAPELLCESEVYGTAVDVWSVGCIFAEILGRKPLFRGSSTSDQLRLIVEKLGTPTDEDLTGITNESSLKQIRDMPRKGKVSMEALFPDANPLALDLLGRMLEFDQTKRISVEAALEHPYLTELHSKAKEPVCDKAFNFDFEKGYPDEMPQRLLQQHMYREMLAIREEQRRKGTDSVAGARLK